MINLLDFKEIGYDSMMIIYYCFNIKNHKIIEYTDKTHELTEFLLKNHKKIIVPSFLISEIRQKGAIKIIEEYISSKQITNLPRNINSTFRLGLFFKFKTKLNKLLKKEWFNICDYNPPKGTFSPIETFFKNLNHHPQYKEFLKKKKRTTPVPSFEDLGLMAFSKDMNCPIISNDNDLTFFSRELSEKKLTGKIFNFNDLDIYNN